MFYLVINPTARILIDDIVRVGYDHEITLNHEKLIRAYVNDTLDEATPLDMVVTLPINLIQQDHYRLNLTMPVPLEIHQRIVALRKKLEWMRGVGRFVLEMRLRFILNERPFKAAHDDLFDRTKRYAVWLRKELEKLRAKQRETERWMKRQYVMKYQNGRYRRDVEALLRG